MEASKRRGGFIGKLGAPLAVALLMGGAAMPAGAETSEVRAAVQPGLTYLPILMMKHHNLVEKHAKAAGLGDLKVTWSTFGSGASMNDALLSDSLDFAPMGTPPLLTIWDKTRGNIDVRAIAAFSAVPQYLLTTNPDVKSIKDFTDKDKIALPAVAVSLQGTELQIAAAKAFGPQNFAALDRLTVSMKHPDAMAALLSGRSEITAHFSNPPFQYQQLKDPRVRKLLSSFDVLGGPTTNGVIAVTNRFREANPKTYMAFLSALDEAMEMIERDKPAAAAVYIKESKSKLDVEFVLDMLKQPDMVFSSVPLRTMEFASFMHERGRIKTKPNSWKDYFFPEIHDRSGG